MAELWDVYDINRNKIGKKIERENYKFKEGEYFLITVAVIMNSKKQVLITRRSETKKTSPLKWDLTGGGTRAGETTLQAICRETSEEIGMKFKPEDATFLKEIRRDGVPSSFKDFWLFIVNNLIIPNVNYNKLDKFVLTNSDLIKNSTHMRQQIKNKRLNDKDDEDDDDDQEDEKDDD